MFTSRTIRRIAGGLVAGGLAMAVPAGATFAATTTTTAPASRPNCVSDFGAAQQLVETALANRVTVLDRLTSDVNAAKALTGSDRATLSADLANELSGIEALQSKVPHDTTCPELRADAHAMVYDYRVYVVMAPQVHLTIVADAESAIEAKLTNLEPKIQEAINDAASHGKNVTAAQEAYSDYQAQVSAAEGATEGVAQTVLAQTPAGAPGNWTVFVSSHNRLESARDHLHSAVHDLQVIVDTLR